MTDDAIRESTAKAVATMRRFRGCYIVVDGDMLVTVVVDGEDSR